MGDVLIRVPQARWLNWLAEGDLPGDEPTESWAFSVGQAPRGLAFGDRCYVASFGQIRGYAPFVAIGETERGPTIVRMGGAVAVTVPGLDFGKGQWTWRYRNWDRESEVPFLTWATEGLPVALARDVRLLMRMRRNATARAELKRRALAGVTRGDALFHGLLGFVDRGAPEPP